MTTVDIETEADPGASGEAPDAAGPPEPSPTPPEGPAGSAVVPYTLPLLPDRKEGRDLAALAVTLANADAIPAALRRKPNDVFLVLLTGRDLGLRPSVAIRSLHVIEGQVTVPPKVKLALVRERGLGRVWPDPDNGPDWACWYGARADDPEHLYASKVTIQDARAIRSKNKPLTDKDNWANYPARMLSWRALGYLLDDTFPEVGTGLYSPDEIGAVTDEDGVPLDVIDVEPLAAGMRGGRGRAAPAEVLMDPAEIDGARRRIARLPAAGQQALKEKWVEKALPHISRLRATDDVILSALLTWVETKAESGDWTLGGDEGPDGTSTATPAGPDNAGEAAADVDGGDQQDAGPAADPAMCLHGDVDEAAGQPFCRTCGERL